MTPVWTPQQYDGNLTWLPKKVIYVTLHGSHAYGTALPTSDMDIRGIFVAPKEYYIGFTQHIEQVQQKEPDLCLFELRKFMRLAADANPNALELLFTDRKDHIFNTPLGDKLLSHRDLFLSQRVKHTFQGYAHSQMKRIRTHRNWLLNPVEIKPTRADFGLPERTVIPADQLAAAHAAIKKKVDQWNWHTLEDLPEAARLEVQGEFVNRLVEITQWGNIEHQTWLAAARSIGFDTNFIEMMDKERGYQARSREYSAYQTWKRERNPDRAALEAKFGFDTKHGMHLVRLSRMCVELLTHGEMRVKRPDAKELLAIRSGAWSYDHLMAWFEEQEARIEEAVEVSTLPKKPNLKALDDLCCSLIGEAL